MYDVVCPPRQCYLSGFLSSASDIPHLSTCFCYFYHGGIPVTQVLINRKSVTPPPTPCHPPRFRFPLLQEAQALVDNPSFVLGGENPLPSRSDTPDGADCRDQYPHHGRHGAWQQSSVVQALRGSACLGVVQELQANAPSCWPRDRYLRCYCSMAVGSPALTVATQEEVRRREATTDNDSPGVVIVFMLRASPYCWAAILAVLVARAPLPGCSHSTPVRYWRCFFCSLT